MRGEGLLPDSGNRDVAKEKGGEVGQNYRTRLTEWRARGKGTVYLLPHRRRGRLALACRGKELVRRKREKGRNERFYSFLTRRKKKKGYDALLKSRKKSRKVVRGERHLEKEFFLRDELRQISLK